MQSKGGHARLERRQTTGRALSFPIGEAPPEACLREYRRRQSLFDFSCRLLQTAQCLAILLKIFQRIVINSVPLEKLFDFESRGKAEQSSNLLVLIKSDL
jgi:hypothetical protein